MNKLAVLIGLMNETTSPSLSLSSFECSIPVTMPMKKILTRYLLGTIRAELAMAIHTCAHFNNSSKLSRERAIIRICRYLLSISEKGIIDTPDRTLGLQKKQKN